MSIYVAPFDSGYGTAGAATRVTDGGPGGDFQPNWSPNGNDIVFGKWILFDRSVPQGGDIFLMRLRED